MRWVLAMMFVAVAVAQPQWVYSENVRYASQHDPRMVELEGGQQVGVEFRGISFEKIAGSVKGRKLLIAYRPKDGAVLVDVATGKYTAILSMEKHPIERIRDRCMDSPEGETTQGMVECMDEGSDRWDQEIQRLCTLLISGLNDSQKAALKAAQESWEKFLNAEMRAIGEIHTGPEFGSISRVSNALAAFGWKQDRARSLAAIYAR